MAAETHVSNQILGLIFGLGFISGAAFMQFIGNVIRAWNEN